ncbi:MAG: hypothetical protein ACI4HM_00450 [Ruminococcus sp.]
MLYLKTKIVTENTFTTPQSLCDSSPYTGEPKKSYISHLDGDTSPYTVEAL